MDKLDFKGIQHIDRKSNSVNIEGYIRILPRQEEFKVPIKGLITIHDTRNLTHEFSGGIIQVVHGLNPYINIYTNGNLGEELFYWFKNRSIISDKLSYTGFWCPIKKETQSGIIDPFGEPSISKYVMLEFMLNVSEQRLLLKKIGFSE